jgi:hypothetical protein
MVVMAARQRDGGGGGVAAAALPTGVLVLLLGTSRVLVLLRVPVLPFLS